MENPQCLNCGEITVDNFCSNCGQKTDTHRIKLKHFFLHDMMHGIWHLEKEILFTLKEIFKRPGQAALDYIKGKRIRYYNVFYLSLLLIGLIFLLSHIYDLINPTKEDSQDTIIVTTFFSKYIKLILLGIVPILALNAYLVFRKLKLNLAEHLIIGGFCLAGMLTVSISYFFMNFLNGFSLPFFLGILEVVFFFLIPLFPFWVYCNAIKGYYSFWGMLWRIMVFYIFVLAELLLILMVIIYMLTGKLDLNVNI